MKVYLDTVRRVLETGTRRPNRTGVDTISTFNVNSVIPMDEGFPLLTTKKISWKNIVVENLWFLSGEPTIALLKKHKCRFWDPWADEHGAVPSPYGNLWRAHPGSQGTADQVRWVLDEIQRNPASRRLVISAWSPENAHTSSLPPCHFAFVFNVQYDAAGEPRLNLHLTQRSCDVALGLPYNIAGYALLLHLFSLWSGLKPGVMGHTLVDAHIYTRKADGSMAEYDHVPGLREQLAREPRALPALTLSDTVSTLDGTMSLLDKETAEIMSHFVLDGYDPHPAIRFAVAV